MKRKAPRSVPWMACLCGLFILALMLVSCASWMPPSVSTALPTEFLPTAAALTLAARASFASPTLAPAVSTLPATEPEKSAVPPSATLAVLPVSPTLTRTDLPATMAIPPSPTSTTMSDASDEDAIQGTATFTPGPPIPDARIQIFRLGELSKVISPLDVSSRLTSGEGKVVRVELFGEDGRLLARDLRTYSDIPWKFASISMQLEFEISVAAELGRLVISAEDSFGRLIEVNSVNIILLKQGMTELNPPSALQQRIVIQEPQEQALIQNSRLIVSGRVRPSGDQPLRVMLVSEEGRILGQRLAGISSVIPGDYGVFVAEIPYTVSEVANALLVVYEEGGVMSEITFLTSLNVILAP